MSPLQSCVASLGEAEAKSPLGSSQSSEQSPSGWFQVTVRANWEGSSVKLPTDSLLHGTGRVFLVLLNPTKPRALTPSTVLGGSGSGDTVPIP